jgi:hypothetical protein
MVHVTVPRGFDGMGRTPRIVVQPFEGGILLHRAPTWAEAGAVRDAWNRGDYSKWPGEYRQMKEQSE